MFIESVMLSNHLILCHLLLLLPLPTSICTSSWGWFPSWSIKKLNNQNAIDLCTQEAWGNDPSFRAQLDPGSNSVTGATCISLFLSLTSAAAAAKSLQSCLTLCDPIGGNPWGSLVPGILQARTLEGVAISFSESEKWKWRSCLTLSDPKDCSLPGSSIHGIFQARVLEWGAIAFSDPSPELCFIIRWARSRWTQDGSSQPPAYIPDTAPNANLWRSVFTQTSKKRFVGPHHGPHSYNMPFLNPSIAVRIKPSCWTSLSHMTTLDQRNSGRVEALTSLSHPEANMHDLKKSGDREGL